jgi:hypothetical protein
MEHLDGIEIMNYVPKKDKTLKEKIAAWMENAKERPEYYEDCGYDPNAYSIEEWEKYLKRKNHNLTFERFVKSKRWRLTQGMAEDKDAVTEFNNRFWQARGYSFEFLSEPEIAYVEKLLERIQELADLVFVYKCAVIDKFEEYGKDSEEYKRAVSDLKNMQTELGFACRWKYVEEDSMPDTARQAISEAILKELENRKWIWCWKEPVDTWEYEKLRLYQTAIKLNALLPEHLEILEKRRNIPERI